MATTKKEKKLAEDKLVLKRVVAVRDVVERFVAEYNHERDSGEISVRLQTLDRTNKEFHHVQSEIEKIDEEENFEHHMAVRAEFENCYCKLKAFLLSKRDRNQPLVNSTMASSFAPPHNSTSFHHRLPKIDLPKFSGDESRWISFRDNFLSMIHVNDDIPAVNKLQYLLQSLEGDARKPFESVDIQADNYASTWEALLKRYDNKRFLRKELFRRLFELSPMKRESALELNTLVDDFQRHVKALGKLGEPIVHWDTPLTFILCNKLDSCTLRAWEQETRQKDEVKYDELVEFLTQQVRMLKSISSDLQHRSRGASITVAGSNPKPSSTFKSVANAVTNETKPSDPQCHACSEKHYLYQCQTFAELPVMQRRELLSQQNLCWNCFRPNHQAKVCRSKFSCRTCHAKHHTLLHDHAASTQEPPNPVLKTTSGSSNTPTQQPIPTTSANVGTVGSSDPPEVNLSVQSSRSTVLLETVVLYIVDKHGKEIPVRALLDSAAMSNFITKKLANALATRQAIVDVAVAGIGQSVKQIKRQIAATVKSRTTSYSTTLEFLIMKQPTANLPTTPINSASWNIPNVPLADPTFNAPGMIDIVIGGGCYHEMHTGNRLSLGNGLPFLIDTHFGWTVSGKTAINSSVSPSFCYISIIERPFETVLQRCWELEAVDHCPTYSTAEKRCEEVNANTATRTHSGRIVVSLPRSEDPQVTLGVSREIATRSLYNLERRLEKNSALKPTYHEFIDEYLHLDHMRKLTIVDDDLPHCHLPHHPMLKQSSTTTMNQQVRHYPANQHCQRILIRRNPSDQLDIKSDMLRFKVKMPLPAEWEGMLLHLFSDGSEFAYGACCHVHSDTEDRIPVQPFTSTSKVAPLAVNKYPIAQFELNAVVLSSRSLQKVEQLLRVPCDVSFWTISTIVLQWRNLTPTRWKTFVANRMPAIQSNTEGYFWKHVPGKAKPVIELSRGLSPIDLCYQTCWWIGALWRSQHPSYWSHASPPDEETQFVHQLCSRYSTHSKLRRIVVYYIKHIHLLKTAVRESKWLKSLLTNEGFLPVGGQLENSSISATSKHLINRVRRSSIVELPGEPTKNGRAVRNCLNAYLNSYQVISVPKPLLFLVRSTGSFVFQNPILLLSIRSHLHPSSAEWTDSVIAQSMNLLNYNIRRRCIRHTKSADFRESRERGF